LARACISIFVAGLFLVFWGSTLFDHLTTLAIPKANLDLQKKGNKKYKLIEMYKEE